jgi:malate dehydrogenase (oxaloacetate-decarboxylating)(NADP+)
MLQAMAERPIVFALANPTPEISYQAAKAARPDAIVATGRSDFPNQANNVLGFPGIFRGALDVRARAINEEMKIAATNALASLAKEDVPDSVLRAYGLSRLQFGTEYIIPKPFDPRVLVWVSSAVAEAAMSTNVAQVQIDLTTYRDELARRLTRTYGVMQNLRHRAQAAPKRIVFSEGEHDKVLRAELGFEDMRPQVIDPAESPRFEAYVQEFYRLRRRGGVTLGTAREQMLNPNYFGAMMVHMGDADGFVAGVSQNYPETIRPALQIIKTRPNVRRVAAVFVIITKKDVYFFADTHVNIDPSAEDLAEIAVMAAEVAREFDIEPRVAMLSFSNFGSNHHPDSEKMRRAVELALEKNPELMVDGEMMADTALAPELIEEEYPFSQLKGGATVLIFPDLGAANIAYKMMMRIGGAESLGPILMGLCKPVHVLQRGASVEEIVNMAAIAVVDAQKIKR